MYGRNTCLSFLPLYLMGEPMVFQSSIIIFGSLGLCLVYFSPKWCEPTCLMEGFDLSNQWNLYFTPKKHWSANLAKKYRDWLNQEMYAYTPISYLTYIYDYDACMCVFICLLINYSFIYSWHAFNCLCIHSFMYAYAGKQPVNIEYLWAYPNNKKKDGAISTRKARSHMSHGWEHLLRLVV